jgi:hypothetical protein
MDFFASQGTAVPSTGSSGGDWEDWFLDMEGRKPFGRTISPDDDERGDWMDWYLNREGPAGRFRGSRRPRYDIDYLFNDGGSVRSRPSASPGPKTRQKLQPRSADVLGNLSDRYFRSGNVEGMKSINQELQNRIQNHPALRPGTGGIFNTSPMEGGSIDPRSFWNVGLQSGDNTGVMAFNDLDVNQMKDNYFGHRLIGTGWGQGILKRLIGEHGPEGDLERLEEALPDLGDEKRGWLGADWDFDIEEGNDGWKVGAKATWNTPWWLGG